MLFKLLKEKKSLIIFTAATTLFFLLNVYIMKTLPGARNEACVIGAGFNTINVIFTAFTSLAFGLLLMGMTQLYKQRKTTKNLRGGGKHVAGATIVGSVISFFTVFCVACTLPFITIFGTAISLNFLTDFEIEFKLLSLTLMFLALYLLNKQLEGCAICEQ